MLPGTIHHFNQDYAMQRRTVSSFITLCVTLALLLAGAAADAVAQKRPATIRDFLQQYKGKDVQIMDRTGGTEQFVTGDPTKTYVLSLVDVQNDYIVVGRNTASDKRNFIYPISVIRRIIFAYDWKPYQMILIEMY
jgi:hypothetical protein